LKWLLETQALKLEHGSAGMSFSKTHIERKDSGFSYIKLEIKEGPILGKDV
jgi:hypothetical protein